MTEVENFRDRLNSDAKFAAQFANVSDESGFIELANSEGYSLAPQDLYDELELTDQDLEMVQGGVALFFLLIAGLLAGTAVYAGGGFGIGFAISKRKK